MSTKQQSVEHLIIQQAKKVGEGSIFFPEDFITLGSDEAVRIALFRLENKGILIRLAHGIYLYPEQDEMLGVLYPSLDEIAQAIARRDRARILPTGVQALNKLGLSTQVPMKAVYLTDGVARDIKVGKRGISFKRTTPRNLAVKGEISSLVIQALKEIGKDNVNEGQLAKLKTQLDKESQTVLTHDARLAPAWIRKIMLNTLPKDA